MKPNPFARGFDIFNRSLDSRGLVRGITAKKKDEIGEIAIRDVIGADPWTGGGITADGIAAELKSLAGAKSLVIYLSSPGGSIFEAKSIYSQLKRFDGHKTVVNESIAASAASFIAMAGDRIITSEGATWMVHRAMGGAYGFEDDLRAVADVLKMESENIAAIYAKRTGRPVSEMLALMDAETWMNAAEAKAAGFTDEIEMADATPEAKPRVAAQAPPVVAAIDQTRKIAASLASMKREVILSQYRTAASPRGVPASPAK